MIKRYIEKLIKNIIIKNLNIKVYSVYIPTIGNSVMHAKLYWGNTCFYDTKNRKY